jgi:hypothetical protein
MKPPSCAASPPVGDGAHCDDAEFFIKSSGNLERVMLRRGGAPSGAAASIVRVGMGASAPIIANQRIQEE